MIYLPCLTSEEHTEGHEFTSNHNINEAYLPEVGAEEGKLPNPSGLVLDAFCEDFGNKVKAVTKPMDKLDYLLMDEGIMPKAQPLDVLIIKSSKDSSVLCGMDIYHPGFWTKL